MSGRTELFDPGLQPERTALAWRRTLLALVVVTVVGERLLSPVVGWPALPLAGAGLGAVSALLVLARRRAAAAGTSLREHGDLSAAPGGALLAGTALACAAVGLLVLLAVVLRGLPG